MKENTKSEKIINRILKKIKMPHLLDTLCEQITPTDLQSLLIALFKKRAARLSPSFVLKQYEQNRFVQLARTDMRISLEFDIKAFKLLPPGYDIVELSPVAPLGSCSTMAAVDQNNVVCTIRNTEVCADVTNLLALECAKRIRNNKIDRLKRINLCTSQRLLRAQYFTGPASFSHFRVLGLCTAGKDNGGNRFELASLAEHMDYYLRLIQYYNDRNRTIKAVKVVILPIGARNNMIIEKEISEPLVKKYPDIGFEIDLQQQRSGTYYIWARFQVYCLDNNNQEYLIVDGGFTDWTQKLLNNKKERLLISGMGSERFLVCFK